MPVPPQLVGLGFDAKPENINSTGLNKGCRHRSTIMKELLRKQGKDGVDRETNMNEAILKKAEEGDLPSYKEIQDTVYGRLAEKKEEPEVVRSLKPSIVEELLKYVPEDVLKQLMERKE